MNADRKNRLRRKAARRIVAAIESLESRLHLSLTRTISGHIFNDINGDGKRQPREHFLAGVEVFIDLAGNGVLSTGDPSTVTNRGGVFTFRKLPKGIYTVREIPPIGDVATIPVNGVDVVDVTKHSVLNLHFGDKVTPPPPPSTAPPSADLAAPTLATAGITPYRFEVVWSDPNLVDASSLGDGNIVVSGPLGYSEPASLVALDSATDGTPRTATYQIPAPSGGWDPADNGLYTVTLQAGQVRDILGYTDPMIALGTFSTAIGSGLQAPQLAGGIDGATSLNNLTPATALSFTVAGALPGAQLTLLADGVAIGSTTANSTTATISSNGQSILTDGEHSFVVQEVSGSQTYDSPASSILVDTTGPTESLSAPTLSVAGGTTYSFSVTYSDASAVSLASLGGAGLLVTGPKSYRQTSTLVSVNTGSDIPVCVATYQIPAPSGTWVDSDNGTYTVQILGNSVEDVLGNFSPAKTLGTIHVSVGAPVTATPGVPALSAATDSGVYDDDGVTNFNNSSSALALSFSVSGTIAGATVTIYSDGTAIGSAVATGAVTSVTTNGAKTLSDGSHLITAAQQSPGYSLSTASSPSGIVVDTAPPAARSSPPNVSGAGATSYTFLVAYSDNYAVHVASIGDGNITVTGPNAFSAAATLVSVNSSEDGSPRTATYTITPPGGSWQASNQGTYTVTLNAGQVYDTAGNYAAGAVLGTFIVNTSIVASPTPAAPTLAAVSDTGVSNSDGLTDLNNSSVGSELQFVVGSTVAGAVVALYANGVQIGSATASGATTTVTTNGTVKLADGPNTITARQTVTGDGQSVDSTATTITIDTSPPAATGLSAAPVSAAASTYSFSVTYGDNTAVNVASIGNTDVTVTEPGGTVLATTFVQALPNSNTTPITATYQLIPPGGMWTSADNGTYTIKLVAGQITDTAGNPAAAQTLGTFTVSLPQPQSAAPAAPALQPGSDTGASNSDGLTKYNNSTSGTKLSFNIGSTIAGATVTLYADGTAIASAVASGATTVVTTNGSSTISDGTHSITARQTVPGDAQSVDSSATTITIDTSPPSAIALTASNVSAVASSYQFTVEYGDNIAVNIATLGAGEVTMTGPGPTVLVASLVSTNPMSDGTPITATYQVTPPGGAWSSADNGQYTIALLANHVQDTAGNFANAQTLGNITVAVSAPVTATPATPVLQAVSDTGISNSDDITNLNNGAPADELQFSVGNTISGATVTIYSDGTAIGSAVASGTTTVVTTNGTTTLPDGVHAITATQQVSGQAISAASTALNVTIDTTPPAAMATLSNITTGGGTTYTFTVTYTDANGVNETTFDNNNILVTGPNGYSQLATMVMVDNPTSGSPRTVTYQITPADSAWSASDDGTYTVTLQSGQVYDVAGNAAPQQSLGTFNVTL